MPGQHIVQGSSDLWVESGAQAERSLNTGWILDQVLNSTGGFATNAGPSTATAFLSTGDGTTGSGNGYYALLRKLRIVHAGGTAYCRATASSYSTTTTQTTVTVGDFQSGTTSLSTASITSVAAAAMFYGSGGAYPQEAGLRATGDMLYRDSTGVTRLTVGTSSQTLFGGTVPQWATVPVTVAPGYSIEIIPWAGHKTSVGTVRRNPVSTMLGGGYTDFTTGTQNNEITWDIWVDSGTFSLFTVAGTNTDRGIMSHQLDGSTVTTQDLYASPGADNTVLTSTGLSVGSPTATRVYKVLMATKNASSSNYGYTVQSHKWIRTGA